MNNKIGIHYGSFVTDWKDDQLPLIKKAKTLGFDLFEFGMPFLLEMSSDDRRRFRDEAYNTGINLAVSMALSPGEDIGSPDSGCRSAGLALLKGTAAAMTEVGASDCSGIIHGAWNAKIESYDEKGVYWKNSVAVMKEAAKVFEDHGVFFNVEVVNRFENFLINCCEEVVQYLSEVGSPHVGIHLDTFHMNIEENSMVEAILNAGEKLRNFHIGENNRKFPGLGTMPWKQIFDTLKAIDYSHPITMEPFVKPGGEVGAAVSLYRELMDTRDYDEDIRSALTFVKNLMK